MVNSGDQRTVNLNYTYIIHTWTPTGKKSCGSDPYA